MPLESRNIAPELNGNAAALLAIIGQALDAIIAVDTSQKIILFNQAAESVFGRTAETMLGQPIDILLPERFRQGHAELMQSFTQSGRTQRHIGKLGVIWGLRADGTEFPAEAAISRTESDGKIILAVILRDITEREQIQNELIAQKNLHAMISQASQAIAQAADEKDIFRKICCIAVERGSFKFAWIGKINEARDTIVPVEKYGDDQGFLQEIGQLPKDSARELHRAQIANLEAQGHIVHNDFLQKAEKSRWHYLAKQAGVRSVGAFPIQVKGKITGVLALYAAERGYFTEKLIPTLQAMAADVSVAIESIEISKTLREAMQDNILLAEIARSMNEACFALDKDWRFTFVNERGRTLLRHTREEMLGNSIWEVFHLLLGTPMEQNYRRAMAERIPVSFEAFSPVAERWLDIRLFPSGTGLAAFLMDISDRKKSEELFREVVENIEQVFWITNPDKNEIIYVSPAYDKIWGRKGTELYQNPAGWLEAIHPEDQERVKQALPGQLQGVFREDYRIVRPDGSVRWISDRAFPIPNPEGKIYHLVGIAQDITDRIQLEMQLRQSQKMEAIGQLSAGVAHDFNNLMTVIQGNNALGAEETDPKLRNIFTSEINKAIEKAATLTRQLLLVGRQQVLNLRDIDLNETIKQILLMLQRIVGEDIDLRFHTPANPLIIRADPGMVSQILLNLTVNSRDAMPKGGQIIIDVSEENFDAGAADLQRGLKPGHYARISVSDTGPGIPKEIQSRVFEPFFTTKDVGKGTGLGLATVFSIVQQHDGWINLYSEPGMGTTFRIHLPLIKTLAVTAEETEETTSFPPGQETILIVEDELPIRKMLQTFLSKLGYRILEAGTGNEALQVWEKSANEIDMLMTDVIMPDGMNGVELAKRLSESNPALKVIYSSGYSADLMRSRNVVQEGLNFIPKPYSLSNLANTVRRCFDQPGP